MQASHLQPPHWILASLTHAGGAGGGGSVQYTLLPAWRWTFPSLHTQYGGVPGITQALTAISSFFFDIAGAIWSIILWIVKISTDTTLVKSAADHMNSYVAALFQTLEGADAGTTGHYLLIGAILVIAITYAVWRALTRGVGGMLRTFLACIIPLGLFFTIGNAAVDSKTGVPAVMSPAWIATTVNQVTTTVADWLPKQIGNATTTKTTTPTVPDPSCLAYQDGLVAQFTAAASTSGSDAAVPIAVSKLWSDSYLTSWETAQFGTTTVGRRVGCRYLELKRDVPATGAGAALLAVSSSTTEFGQATIDKKGNDEPATADPAGATGGRSVYSPFTATNTPTGTGTGTGTGTSYPEPSYLPIAMSAWMYCSYTGGKWQAAPGFEKIVSTDWYSTSSNKSTAAKACSEWWSGWTSTTESSSGPFGLLYPTNKETKVQSQTHTAPVAQNVLTSFNGDNGGAALLDGVFGFASSGAYGFAIGGLSLVTMLAQLILVILLCALPLLLLLMALPGNFASRVGREMLKVGIGAATAKILFGVLLGLLMEIIKFFDSFLVVHTAGFFEILVVGLTPLLALLTLSYLMKRLGMGGLLNVKGMLQTAGAVMGGATASGALTGRYDAMKGGVTSAGRMIERHRTREALRGGGSGRGGGQGTGPRPPTVGARVGKGARTAASAAVAGAGSAARGIGQGLTAAGHTIQGAMLHVPGLRSVAAAHVGARSEAAAKAGAQGAKRAIGRGLSAAHDFLLGTAQHDGGLLEPFRIAGRGVLSAKQRAGGWLRTMHEHGQLDAAAALGAAHARRRLRVPGRVLKTQGRKEAAARGAYHATDPPRGRADSNVFPDPPSAPSSSGHDPRGHIDYTKRRRDRAKANSDREQARQENVRRPGEQRSPFSRVADSRPRGTQPTGSGGRF